MADISNAELKKEIQGILKDADLDNTSAKKVFQEAECLQRPSINNVIDLGAANMNIYNEICFRFDSSSRRSLMLI